MPALNRSAQPTPESVLYVRGPGAGGPVALLLLGWPNRTQCLDSVNAAELAGPICLEVTNCQGATRSIALQLEERDGKRYQAVGIHGLIFFSRIDSRLVELIFQTKEHPDVPDTLLYY